MKESISFSECTSVISLLKLLCDWQLSHREANSFSRIFFYTRIFSTNDSELRVYGKPMDDFINADMAAVHVPVKIHTTEDGTCFLPNVNAFLTQFARSTMANEAILHQYMVKSGLKYWAAIERLTVNLQAKVQKMQAFPKTNSDSMNSIVMTSFTLWSQRIAYFMAIKTFTLGFSCEIYNHDDYAIIFLTLAHCYRNLASVIRNQRIADGVYKHLPPKKQGKKQIVRSLDVQKEVDVKTPEEVEIEVLSHFMDGAFHFMRYCIKTGSVKVHKGPFYDFKSTYDARTKPFKDFYPPLIIPYGNFEMLYNFDSVSPAKLKEEVNKKWGSAKEVLKTVSEKSQLLKNLLKAIVMSSIDLMKHKEGDKFTIKWTDGIPSFLIQT